MQKGSYRHVGDKLKGKLHQAGVLVKLQCTFAKIPQVCGNTRQKNIILPKEIPLAGVLMKVVDCAV